jgi:hypothetical protein
MKIDKILAQLMAEGKITIEEALAIGGSVRFVTLNTTEEQKEEFFRRYGALTQEGFAELLTPA